MTNVHLPIDYETLLMLIEQLPEAQKQALVEHLTHQSSPAQEKMSLLRAAQIHAIVNENPSIRREDWYDDER